jgi:cytochrome P450
MIAGRDTTACALSWGFYELSKRPHIVQKIVEEVEQICGVDDPDYSYDKICQLRYTHAVVMEVLRLHPSVPNDHKYAVE